MAAGGTSGPQARACGITASTLVKAMPGRLAKVHVLVAGGSAGGIYDTNTTGSVAVSNQVAAIPNAVGYYDYECPLQSGLVVVPGSGQTVTVTYT